MCSVCVRMCLFVRVCVCKNVFVCSFICVCVYVCAFVRAYVCAVRKLDYNFVTQNFFMN